METYKLIFFFFGTVALTSLFFFYIKCVSKKKYDLKVRLTSALTERKFMENLVNKRFNFLLIIFGLVLVASYQIRESIYLDFTLLLSFIVLVSLSITIFRAQVKLDYILKWMFKNKKEHAVSRVHKEVGGLSVRGLIGFHLPVALAIVHYAMLILSLFSVLLPVK